MKDKKIDIIIPAYKAHKTIEKTLHSIAIQSIIDKVDVTIVNDCCPEGDYQDTIKLFSNFMDIKEIKLDKNCGPGEARNQGMKNTKNDYIMFVDADDYLILPKSLEQMLGIMEDNKQLIVLRSDILEENENCEFGAINGEVDSHVFARLYRRNFIEDNNIWFPPFRANEDVGFNMLFEMKSFYKGESLGVINTPTYF
jgi:glycosyltransferase involved in cell wall biosynthesis